MSTHERKASIREFYGRLCCCPMEIDHWIWFGNLFYGRIAWYVLHFCQLWYIPLFYNFKVESPTLRIKNRKLFAWRDTGREMKRNIDSTQTWILKEKKSVEFAWRWIVKLCYLTAIMWCAWNAIENGNFFQSVSWLPSFGIRKHVCEDLWSFSPWCAIFPVNLLHYLDCQTWSGFQVFLMMTISLFDECALTAKNSITSFAIFEIWQVLLKICTNGMFLY